MIAGFPTETGSSRHDEFDGTCKNTVFGYMYAYSERSRNNGGTEMEDDVPELYKNYVDYKKLWTFQRELLSEHKGSWKRLK
jgi:hypothetical protein